VFALFDIIHYSHGMRQGINPTSSDEGTSFAGRCPGTVSHELNGVRPIAHQHIKMHISSHLTRCSYSYICDVLCADLQSKSN
jgi:hypothetical protein